MQAELLEYKAIPNISEFRASTAPNGMFYQKSESSKSAPSTNDTQDETFKYI